MAPPRSVDRPPYIDGRIEGQPFIPPAPLTSRHVAADRTQPPRTCPSPSRAAERARKAARRRTRETAVCRRRARPARASALAPCSVATGPTLRCPTQACARPATAARRVRPRPRGFVARAKRLVGERAPARGRRCSLPRVVPARASALAPRGSLPPSRAPACLRASRSLWAPSSGVPRGPLRRTTVPPRGVRGCVARAKRLAALCPCALLFCGARAARRLRRSAAVPWQVPPARECVGPPPQAPSGFCARPWVSSCARCLVGALSRGSFGCLCLSLCWGSCGRGVSGARVRSGEISPNSYWGCFPLRCCSSPPSLRGGGLCCLLSLGRGGRLPARWSAWGLPVLRAGRGGPLRPALCSGAAPRCVLLGYARCGGVSFRSREPPSDAPRRRRRPRRGDPSSRDGARPRTAHRARRARHPASACPCRMPSNAVVYRRMPSYAVVCHLAI